MTRDVAASWDELERELDRWRADAGTATFWWRDDDAVSATPALDRLLALRGTLPLALAVIPGKIEDSLARRLTSASGVAVLQHGWMHRNHAPKGERAAELGAHRPIEVLLRELALGWSALVDHLSALVLPILTPPWNRLCDSLIPRLRESGYAGLSTSGARPRREAASGLVQVNAHLDVVDWRSPLRPFIGEGAALTRLIDHLAAKRERRVDATEPTGILTHHLVMDRASELFLERLVARTQAHGAVRWLGAAEAFALP